MTVLGATGWGGTTTWICEYAQGILARLPGGYWRHEAGSIAVDSSGNGNDATTTTDVSEVAGFACGGGAGSYNGTTSAQIVPADASIDNLSHNTNVMTFEALVYPVSFADEMAIAHKMDAAPNTCGWIVWVTLGGEIRFLGQSNGVSANWFGGDIALNLNDWNLVTIVADNANTERSILINGESALINIVDNTGGALLGGDAGNALRIGDNANCQAFVYGASGMDSSEGFNGYIDELSVTAGALDPYLRYLSHQALGFSSPYLDSVLSDSPVAYYPHEGANSSLAEDWTSNANKGTVTGTLNSATGQIGGAGNYTGTQRIDCPNVAGVNQDLASGSSVFSVELLINPTSLAAVRVIASKGRVANEGWDMNIQTNGAVRMNIHYSVLGGTFDTPAASVTTGTWYHLVIVAQGNATSATGIRKAYVNGSPVAVTHVADPSGVLGSDAAYPLKLGQRLSALNANELAMNGLMDSLVVFNRELLAAEVSARFALTGL